jgi:hypothetical protein
MKMQRIENSTLLVGPERYYIDRYGLPNSYYDCNPSLFINNDGSITILLRQINYKKFSNKTFVLGENKSISKYVIMTGSNISNLQTFPIAYDWGTFPKYGSYWEGMEDIRFITEDSLLVTVPERNNNGNPCLFLAKLQVLDSKNYSIKLLKQLQPCIIEKNWMPYQHNNNNQVIYSLSPFVIKSLTLDDGKEISIDSKTQTILQGYHGSTNGIPFQGELLFLIHKYTNKSEHRWLKFNPDTLNVQISSPFTFYANSYIEFPCSLVMYNNIIYVSLGINDCQAVILSIIPKDILIS